VATGIQPIGDALCHTNPTFALGASLSVMHGFALAEVATAADGGRALTLAFDETVGADAAARFDAVSDEDRDRIRLWKGEQIDIRDPGDSMALFLRLTATPRRSATPSSSEPWPDVSTPSTPRTRWGRTRRSSLAPWSSRATAARAHSSARPATSSSG
jgi:hypothetical protein